MMFFSLVLGHKKCFMGIYLEMLMFGVKIKLRNACACKREGRALFWGFYGILWFYDFVLRVSTLIIKKSVIFC